ncbi:15-hydroxyprostaglandin dehydrogenase [Xylariomycetidae sp. FL0641]|nr:15-hydroxyprostaglandin dehydrogenase [Xylariomycetidae sp. FL0641]
MAGGGGSDHDDDHGRAPPNQKVVVVTGGASGLGLAMTEHFAAQGHRVAVLDVDGAAGPRVAAGAVSFRRCDVASWDALAAAFRDVYEECGRIDVVMANAGVSEQGASSIVVEGEDEPRMPDLKVLQVNLLGTIYTVKLAVHYMSKNNPPDRRGAIVCTASNAGLYGFPVAPLYATSKFGVVGLVRSLGRVLARRGIRINALAPAVLETNIAPSKDLFNGMVVTPMSTLVAGVKRLVDDDDGDEVTGAVAEIAGENVTIRPQHEFVDEDSRRNIEHFWNLGYA